MKPFRDFKKPLVFLFLVGNILFAQDKLIKGTVTDMNQSPIPGVNVLVKGTNNGQVTNMDGTYTIQVKSTDTIVFSFIGMKSIERVVGDATVINVQMEEDANVLQDVVVIAYGAQSKRKITGAMETIQMEETEDLPVAQLTQKLQGKLSGVQILQNTGTPGGGMSVRIRGQASISAGSQPLYVVDGFPITGDISNINPSEIESISVLKDASATSLYGSRAANGVVLVTTKRNKGATRLSVSAYYGTQQIPDKGVPDMLNATEFAQFKKEIYEARGQNVPEAYQNPEIYGKGTDWFDLITRTAPIENYTVSFTGGENLRTAIVAGFFKQEGVLLNSNYNRFSIRTNTDYDINDKIKVGVNLAPTYTTRNSPQTDGVWYNTNGIIQGALLTNPISTHINEDGSTPYGAPGWSTNLDGVAAMPNWYHQVQAVKNVNKSIGLLSNVFLEAELLPHLTYKLMTGVDIGSSVNDYFSPSTAGGVFNPGNPNDPSRISGSHSNSFGYSWLVENTLKYDRTFGDHALEILGGYTSQKARGENAGFNGTGYPDNRVQTLSAATTITGGSSIEEWSLVSVLSRVNYSFKDKYIVSGSFRTDGSSKFGSDNRWGNFPSVSVGWLLSEESFMKQISSLNLLKFRASYGVTGNNNIGNYTQFSSVVSTNYALYDQLYNGKSLDGLENNELGWERTTQKDFGVDLSLFNNRINLSYDYYYKKTNDLLYTVEIPISSGFYNYATNIGDFKFWGHEFNLNTKNFIKGDFKWETNFNITFNRNEVLKLGTDNAPIRGEYTITEVGGSIGQLYGLQADGIFQNEEELANGPTHTGAGVGSIRFVDQNGDGVVTNDERDFTYLGDTNPDFNYGFTSTFRYKNFDLSVVAQGAVNNKIVNVVERFTGNLDGAFNVNRGVLNRWRSEEDPGSGRYGSVAAGTTGPERDWFHSKIVYDATYLTIKNITLGYNVPVKSESFLKDLRFYGSVQQAFVFTKYPGANPEVSNAGGLGAGTDSTTYPIPRTFTVGLNLTL